MQEIKAFIQPFKLDDVITALHKIDGLPGIAISEIRGFGKSKAKDSPNAFQEGLHQFVKKVKIELVAHNDMIEQITDTIQQISHTGNPGDGKIFVYDVKETIKIRTNEHGEKAI